MPAYAVFIHNKTHDATLLEEYRRVARPTIGQYGGRPLVVPASKKSVVEGSGIENLIVIEFADIAAARGWYESPEYKAASLIRTRACDCQVILTEGI